MFLQNIIFTCTVWASTKCFSYLPNITCPTTEIVEAQWEIMNEACDMNKQSIRYGGGSGGGKTETVIMPMGVRI